MLINGVRNETDGGMYKKTAVSWIFGHYFVFLLAKETFYSALERDDPCAIGEM